MKNDNSTLLIAILLIVLPMTFSYGQSVDQLDSRYGFKSLKLGTVPNPANSVLIESWDSNPNITSYRYQGGDIESVYNVPVKNVDLTYYKNRLMSIQVSFQNGFSESDYDRILYSLKQLFGGGDNCNVADPDFSLSFCRKWIGKKVDMEILRLYYQQRNMWTGYLVIVEKSIQQQRIRDDF